MIQAPVACTNFYDRNESNLALYYETMILANLGLASSVNYDHKVRCKLKRTLQS
jgi:hypothetical protein